MNRPPNGLSERVLQAWNKGFAEGLAHEQNKCKCKGRPTRQHQGEAMTPQELAELDLAVAKAEGIEAALQVAFDAVTIGCFRMDGERVGPSYQPTRDGAEAMRLLEKHKSGGCRLEFDSELWKCTIWKHEMDDDSDAADGVGDTADIAICLAVVALKEAEGGTNEKSGEQHKVEL